MFKLPFIKFYPLDWLTSLRVKRMGYYKKGIYLDLMCHQWLQPEGRLPMDEKSLRALCPGAKWSTIKEVLEDCFTKDDKGYYQIRLSHERLQAAEKSFKTSEAAKSRYNKDKQDADAERPQKERRDNKKLDSDKEKEEEKSKVHPTLTVSAKVMSLAHEKATGAWNSFITAVEKYVLDKVPLLIEDGISRQFYFVNGQRIHEAVVADSVDNIREEFLKFYREREIQQYLNRKGER